MKPVIPFLILWILSCDIVEAQISEHIKNNKPKYDFLLKKPVPVKEEAKKKATIFSMYTNRQLPAHKLFAVYIPVNYKDQRQSEYFLLDIGASILSGILAEKMHYQYPANPAYYNMNNYWRER